MKTAIVTTTIYIPESMRTYARDARDHGHDDCTIMVVGDRKTPDKARTLCTEASRETGLEVRYISVADQEAALRKFPALDAHLPWNIVQRRNVGHLMALWEGYDVIIAVDDDNHLAEPDYVGKHVAGLEAHGLPALSSPSGWVNVCDSLVEETGRHFFPRGYAPAERIGPSPAVSEAPGDRKVVVNAGLWLGDPDVDAVTRLAAPVNVIEYRRNGNYALDHGAWCPFNSQNTAIRAEALASWFLSPFIGRYDDIWGGYMLRACADALGHTIAFGHPLVRQERHAHDYWVDLDLERMGQRNTDRFCEILREASLPTDGGYGKAAMTLLGAVDEWAVTDETLDNITRASLIRFTRGYRLWIEACEGR